jgi:large subunit ribosomal protein L29
MKASDLREKSAEDLRELQASLAHATFQNRLKNFTNRLDDTSVIRKTKRDVARVVTLLRERELGSNQAEAPADAAAAQPVAAAPAPMVETPKKKIAPNPSAGEGAGTKKKSSKKSEAKQP